VWLLNRQSSLSVRETLRFSARLRLPRAMPETQKVTRVEVS
jgi:ABC-type multidrug transport system ATPase subunit